MVLSRSLAARPSSARGGESCTSDHQAKRNVGESGLHPKPPLPSVNYPARGSPINIPISIGLSRVLVRNLEDSRDLATYRKANTGSSRIMELPVSLYSILAFGLPGGLPREDCLLVGSLGSAGSEGGWGLGWSPACLVGAAAGRGGLLAGARRRGFVRRRRPILAPRW